VIKKIKDKYVLYPKDGGKRLGTHKTKEEALAQERAIEIKKHKKSKSK
jgi:hypothetical protein